MFFLKKWFHFSNKKKGHATKDETKEEIKKIDDGNAAINGNSEEETPETKDYIEKWAVSTGPVGVPTGHTATDFYVYEWFIKDTGEIFYVGKGRGDRYKRFHDHAYEAEKIRKIYDTEVRFVATDLTEEEAIELESKEMARILNETNYRLTNRIVPLLTKRDNGYSRSPDTPELKFETAPYLYRSEIEVHYFNLKPRPFDKVEEEYLKKVVFIERSLHKEIEVIYGGNIEKYLTETKELLAAHGATILKTQYAKSVTAWIYIGDDYVANYEQAQEAALERLGRNVPTYHLIDVWRYLKNKYGEVKAEQVEEIEIQPVHNRVPLEQTKNFNDWNKGFEEGKPLWEEGDKERKAGNINKAIELFDQARYHGYNAPALYNSYAMAYRKLKDYDNEIAILNEAIERASSNQYDDEILLLKYKNRRDRAIELKRKQLK